MGDKARHTECERETLVMAEVTRAIDYHLDEGRGGHPAEMDRNVVELYGSFLALRAAARYRYYVIVLSIVSTAVAIVAVWVSLGHPT